MKTTGLAWLLAGIGLAAGGALLAELMDRGQEPAGGVVLLLVLSLAGYGARRAWRQRRWLAWALMLSAPVLGVALWVAVAMNEALKAA